MVDTYIDSLPVHSTPDGTEILPVQTTAGTPETRYMTFPVLMGIIRTLLEADVANGHVVIDNAIQELLNKTLTSPIFNGGVALTATSTEINILHGCGLSLIDLLYIAGLQDNVQTQIDALNTARIADELEIDDIDGRVTALETAEAPDIRAYTLTVGATSTSLELTEATIQTALGTTKKVSLISPVEIYDTNGTSKYTLLVNAHDMSVQTTNGVVHLDKYGFTVTNGHTYFIKVMAFLI